MVGPFLRRPDARTQQDRRLTFGVAGKPVHHSSKKGLSVHSSSPSRWIQGEERHFNAY